jgi:hypothetical protein
LETVNLLVIVVKAAQQSEQNPQINNFEIVNLPGISSIALANQSTKVEGGAIQ